MKRMLTAVVLAATAASLALAQSSGNQEKTQDDANAKLVETFTKIENEWAQADKTMDANALGASFNLNMKCWETLLPHVVRHPRLRVDLASILRAYQRGYPGAMYSGCGGGYLMVVSVEAVPGALSVNIRTTK